MSCVTIRPIRVSDTANILKWRNSPNVMRNLFTQDELTEDQHLQYLKNIVDSGKCFQFIITLNDGCTRSDIGTVFIKNVDRHSNKGEFGIFIGESTAQGKGYAKLAIQEILQFAFNDIDLNRVYLSVISDNIAAIKAYKHAGFIVEGSLKEDYLRNDNYVDVIIMGFTKTMWINHKE